MRDTTIMITAACDVDKQPTYARHLMTLNDAILEYVALRMVVEIEKEIAAEQGDYFQH